MPRVLPISAVVLATLAASACGGGVSAPRDPNVCWSMVRPAQQNVRFNRLGEEADLEHCAARLERLRLQGLGLGTGRNSITGAYQGRFLFLDPQSIKTGKSLTGNRYVILARAGDGRLVVPGAMRRVAVQP